METNNIEIKKLGNNTWEWGQGTYITKFEGKEYPQVHINRNSEGDLLTLYLDETPLEFGGLDWTMIEDDITSKSDYLGPPLDDCKRLYEFHPFCRGY